VRDTLMSGVPTGITITALIPRRAAWTATPCAWFPADAATTPRRFSSSDSCDSLLYAPRALNEPVSCRFSSFSHTSAPADADSVEERDSGVRTMDPRVRMAAASMSARVITQGRCAPRRRRRKPRRRPARKGTTRATARDAARHAPLTARRAPIAGRAAV